MDSLLSLLPEVGTKIAIGPLSDWAMFFLLLIDTIVAVVYEHRNHSKPHKEQ